MTAATRDDHGDAIREQLDAALVYAARGWRVFPCWGLRPDRHCACGVAECQKNAGKHPLGLATPRGCIDATTDPDTIRRWWERWPDANVAIATGRESSLIVLDVDPRHDGDESLMRLEAEHAALPETAVSLTGGGGTHQLFAHPGDREVANRVNLAGYAGVDLKGDGGYIVAPPSAHASGGVYAWNVMQHPADVPLATAPAWLLDLAEQGPNGERVDFEPTGATAEPDWLAALLEADASIRRRFGRDAAGLTDASPSGVDLSLVSLAAHRGLIGEQLEALLRASRSRATLPPKPASYYRATIGKALAGAQEREQRQHDEREASGGDTDASEHGDPLAPRPEIVLTDRQLDDVVADGVAALIAANDPPSLFLRGGAVVSVRRDEDGRPIVADVPETAIVERLACAARWYKFGRKGNRLDAGPTASLASTVLQRLLKHADALPPLRGVTESPLLRADGSILDREGYDPSTRLYYAPAAGFTLARVPHRPTEIEIEHARGLLDDLLGDFPCVTDADYATAIAALVTVPLREMVPGCVPAQLFDAPAPGTGKGLLADAVAMLATGGLGAKATEPDARSDDEWRKRITALLLEGRAVAVLDNIERPIGSAALAAALTTSVWSDRVLGSSRMLTLPNRAVWIATGNNLRLRGDLPRRCVWCRLDAKVARPWTREGFRHPDLIGWVREQRGELLAAVFTLARAWIAAGRPEPDAATPRLGSYESWRHVVGGTLRVAGVKGFLSNLGQLYDLADDDTPAWAAFLATWQRVYAGAPIAVAELLRHVREGLAIAEALPPDLAATLDKPGSAAKRIGHALKRKAETRYVVDDAGTTLRLVRDFDSAANRAGWRVLP